MTNTTLSNSPELFRHSSPTGAFPCGVPGSAGVASRCLLLMLCGVGLSVHGLAVSNRRSLGLVALVCDGCQHRLYPPAGPLRTHGGSPPAGHLLRQPRHVEGRPPLDSHCVCRHSHLCNATGGSPCPSPVGGCQLPKRDASSARFPLAPSIRSFSSCRPPRRSRSPHSWATSPWLRAFGMNRWLVVFLVGCVLSLQHMFFAFQLDWPYDLWLAVKFLPFAIWTGGYLLIDGPRRCRI